jgi:hypothetical protein
LTLNLFLYVRSIATINKIVERVELLLRIRIRNAK